MAGSTRSPMTAADDHDEIPAHLLRLQLGAGGQHTLPGRRLRCRAGSVDGGRPIGILTDRDVALAVANNPDLGNRPVSEFMSKDVIPVSPALPSRRSRALQPAWCPSPAVVDAAGQLQGIVAWSDLAPHVSEASLGRMVGEVDEGGVEGGRRCSRR